MIKQNQYSVFRSLIQTERQKRLNSQFWRQLLQSNDCLFYLHCILAIVYRSVGVFTEKHTWINKARKRNFFTLSKNKPQIYPKISTKARFKFFWIYGNGSFQHFSTSSLSKRIDLLSLIAQMYAWICSSWNYTATLNVSWLMINALKVDSLCHYNILE